jgi:hypothetical protein
MESINKKFEQHYNTPSDINEHLKTLYTFATSVSHITEMGVRWVSSTWAFLKAHPKKMISYDIIRDAGVSEVESLASEHNINFKFIEADVLKVEIEPTDLLFIDTLHTYNQLFSELTMHAAKVKQYIILHDTVTFGTEDEKIYDHASDFIKDSAIYGIQDSMKNGLQPAINAFLDSKEGQSWTMHMHFKNNNGLTVLKRN